MGPLAPLLPRDCLWAAAAHPHITRLRIRVPRLSEPRHGPQGPENPKPSVPHVPQKLFPFPRLSLSVCFGRNHTVQLLLHTGRLLDFQRGSRPGAWEGWLRLLPGGCTTQAPRAWAAGPSPAGCPHGRWWTSETLSYANKRGLVFSTSAGLAGMAGPGYWLALFTSQKPEGLRG